MNDYRSGGSLDRCEVIKVKATGAESPEMTIYNFMSDAISDAWTKAKSMQSRYKGG